MLKKVLFIFFDSCFLYQLILFLSKDKFQNLEKSYFMSLFLLFVFKGKFSKFLSLINLLSGTVLSIHQFEVIFFHSSKYCAI